jgi:biopolymer transport protein ExbD
MQLNVTSMIDVVFQLLIYFVVTASFAANEGVLATHLPYGGQGEETMAMPTMPLKITLTAASDKPTAAQIAVNDQAVPSFTALRKELIDLQHAPKRGREGAFAVDDPVKIQPRGRVRWQHVVNAFNAAVGARYTNVTLTTPK